MNSTSGWFDFEAFTNGGFALETFAPEDRIFSTGEKGDCFYVVKSGQVNIIHYGTILENVREQGMFGEMALIDDAPRSANAIAAESTELAPIDKAAFYYLVRRDPEFALRVMRLLSERLRRLTGSI
jgi:CRP/FNR family transcriptional regulator, cyclic AMP receptor protein